MEGLLKQARISLEDYFSPKFVKEEERFSRDLFRNAQGIGLISEGKGGLMFAGKAGTGIVLCRIEDKLGEWSGPLAIGTGGLSWGLQGGIAKCDHIILLQTPHHVHTFMAKGSVQVSGNVQFAVGKVGRDAGMGVGASDKAVAPILSYSFKSEGLYGGLSLEGALLTSRNDCNDDFYGSKHVSIEDIITGKIKPLTENEDYNKIITLLNEYCNAPHPIEAIHDEQVQHQHEVEEQNKQQLDSNNNNNNNKNEGKQDQEDHDDFIDITDVEPPLDDIDEHEALDHHNLPPSDNHIQDAPPV